MPLTTGWVDVPLRVPPPAFDPDGITEGLEKLGNLIAKL